MIKILLFFGVLTISISSFAVVDFNGHWKSSTGMMTTSKDQKTPCTNIEIVMKQEEGEIVFNVDHEEIGTLKGDTLITSEAIGGAVYAFNLKSKIENENENENENPVLQSYYGTKNLLGAIVIEGNLELVP